MPIGDRIRGRVRQGLQNPLGSVILVISDCDNITNWSLGVGQGSISLDTVDFKQGLASVRGSSTNPVAQAFGLRYDMTVKDLAILNKIRLWARMSTVRGGVQVEDLVFFSDVNGYARWWFIGALPTSWQLLDLNIKAFDGQDTEFDISQVRYISLWQSNVQSGDVLRIDDVYLTT